ncbi:hypothetical protein ACLKA7_014385 [Drosophila subpalustris]
MTKSISQCWKRFMRPYLGLMELPMLRGNNNLFLGLSSVLGLIGGAYFLQVGAQRLLRRQHQISKRGNDTDNETKAKAKEEEANNSTLLANMFASVVVCQVEKLLCTPISFAVFAFLFMACTMEVVLLKMTTSAHVFGRPPNQEDWDDGHEHEEDIYYENLENNYEHWARRRRRFHQRQQQLLMAQQQ